MLFLYCGLGAVWMFKIWYKVVMLLLVWVWVSRTFKSYILSPLLPFLKCYMEFVWILFFKFRGLVKWNDGKMEKFYVCVMESRDGN